MAGICTKLPFHYSHYLTVSKLLGVEGTDRTTFLSKAEKVTLESLLSETLSQLLQSLKRKSTFLSNLSENNKTLHNFNQATLGLQNFSSGTNGSPTTTPLTGDNQTLVVKAITQSVELPGYNKAADETIVSYNVPQSGPTNA